jgi:hypothetical protein
MLCFQGIYLSGWVFLRCFIDLEECQVPEGTKTPCLIKVEVPQHSLAQNVLQVRIPDDAQVGQIIQVTAPNGANIRCKVPPGTIAGSTIFVEVPPSETPGRVSNSSAPRHVTVKIPHNVKSGDEMEAVAPDGTRFTFRVPVSAVPNTTIRVVINSDDVTQDTKETKGDSSAPNANASKDTSPAQMRYPPTFSAVEPASSLSPPRLLEPAQDMSSASSAASFTRIV